jgi:hypothetical protein
MTMMMMMMMMVMLMFSLICGRTRMLLRPRVAALASRPDASLVAPRRHLPLARD